MFFYCLLSASEKFFLSLRRKEKIKFSRNGICFLLLLIQQKQTASEVCVFTGHVLLTTSHEFKKKVVEGLWTAQAAEADIYRSCSSEALN